MYSHRNIPDSRKVILLVRMWVEIACTFWQFLSRSSSSLWGCELKYDVKIKNCYDEVILLVRMWVEIYTGPGRVGITKVILLVRMWVEMKCHRQRKSITESSSSWGCELKCLLLFRLPLLLRHPPCEDVSWNTFSSLTVTYIIVILLVRMWVEIFRVWYLASQQSVILLVGMWVEITGTATISFKPMSSSLWGCEGQ